MWQAGAVSDGGGHKPGSSDPSSPRKSGSVAFSRESALERLAGETFDVVVVGGGITGAGVALDAASRGLRTALVEKDDFASGTSSKSSKMVHGGIRYLQQRDFRLVYESLAERQHLLENAPHLVTPLPFLIPLFGRDGVVSKTVARSYSSALWLYDLTGGVRIGRRHQRVSKAETLSHLPTLDVERLVAGFLYYDAQADDARLTLTVLRTAVLDHGAVAANYLPAVGFLTDPGGRVSGIRVNPVARPGSSGTGSFGDVAGGPEFDIRARVVVNATGVWADEVASFDDHPLLHSLRPAKGVHVTVPAERLPCDIAAVLPVPGDRRSVFVVPWPEGRHTYVGTTDTAYEGSLDDPTCGPDDVDYLLRAVNAATTSDLTRRDVTGVWAGLRPLLAPTEGRRVSERTADLSRRHTVRTSTTGVITVTGGKLTTFRKMAEDATDQVVRRLGLSGTPSRTKHLRLRGAPASSPPPRRRSTLRPQRGAGGEAGLSAHLRARYGTEASEVMALVDGRPDLLEPVVEGLPYVRAEVLYAVRAEMARSVDDVLSRRTRALLLDARASAAAAGQVAALVGAELGWSDEEVQAHGAAFAERALAELAAAGVAGLDSARGTP